ncbi:MAG: DUF615 domain-containing protein [Gammaproteobacteria bacterium]|nr:DUF615 domain-containing protein [Gammaproteobacteria bacterium]
MSNDDDQLPPSKSQRKRDVEALQDLGAELVRLNADLLRGIALPEALADAIHQARRITSHEGRRRQLQYIGKLMRTVDSVSIRAQLDQALGSSRQHTARLHAIERWRDRLLADDATLTELVAQYPQIDLPALRTLIRGARSEQAAGRPPRQFRALFQTLSQLIPE